MQLGALARLRRSRLTGRRGQALAALVGGQHGRGPPCLHRQGRAGALRRRFPRLALSHRRPRPARGVQRAAPRRGALVRLRRLDRRRVLLPQAPPAARGQGRRARSRTPTTSSSCASWPTSSSAACRQRPPRAADRRTSSTTGRCSGRGYSRTDRAAALFERDVLRQGPERRVGGARRALADDRPLRRPRGREDGFSLRYENWLREAKVPILVLNATTLNTGHNWQFTASWMGEPPIGAGAQVDASRRLRRVYYRDAAARAREPPELGKAVAASACVPGALSAGDAAGPLRRDRRRARRRWRARQPGHRQPARAGLHGGPRQRRERPAARRRAPEARPARRREPVELGAHEPACAAPRSPSSRACGARGRCAGS